MTICHISMACISFGSDLSNTVIPAFGQERQSKVSPHCSETANSSVATQRQTLKAAVIWREKSGGWL